MEFPLFMCTYLVTGEPTPTHLLDNEIDYFDYHDHLMVLTNTFANSHSNLCACV